MRPPEEAGCVVDVVFFYMTGPTGVPLGDRRFGIRLNVAGAANVILPADAYGQVHFYVAHDAQVPFSVVPLYLNDSYTQDVDGGNQIATCGYLPIRVPAGA
jgi:hypothetical protein